MQRSDVAHLGYSRMQANHVYVIVDLAKSSMLLVTTVSIPCTSIVATTFASWICS